MYNVKIIYAKYIWRKNRKNFVFLCLNEDLHVFGVWKRIEPQLRRKPWIVWPAQHQTDWHSKVKSWKDVLEQIVFSWKMTHEYCSTGLENFRLSPCIGLYKKERPPVKQNEKCWLQICIFTPFGVICVQSDMSENRHNLRACSSLVPRSNPKILSWSPWFQVSNSLAPKCQIFILCSNSVQKKRKPRWLWIALKFATWRLSQKFTDFVFGKFRFSAST